MSISSLNTTQATTTTTPSLPAAPPQQQQTNVTVDSIQNTVNVNSITTQLIKSKELTKSSDLLKIKVANIKTDSTEDSTPSASNVLTAAKLSNNLMKSKIMTSTGSIQICLTQPNATLTNINQATTPTTLQTLTLQTPKSILITPNTQSNNTASNSFSLAQAIKFSNNSNSTPINVQSGHTATVLNVLNESNNTQPSVIKAIQLNPPNYIPIQTATTPTTPTQQFNPIIDGSMPITAPAVPIVNLPNRKLNPTIKTNNIIKPTVVSGNSNNISNIVKNLLQSSSSSQATANAQAAVNEAAKIYNQMSEQNQIPQTTTITLSNNINSITSNGSKILSTNLQLVDDSNQNSNNNHITTRNLNVPSITNANKIVLSTNPNVQKTLPLNLKTNQSNGNSPVSFVLDNNQCNMNSNNKTRTIITNSTTPPPNSMITLNSCQVSNFIKTANNINTNNSTNNNNIISIPTNMYKTIPASNQQFLSNMVNLNNQTANTTSQTIAQLCSNLNVQHQMNQPSIVSSIVQPIRLIANHQTNNNFNRTNHVNNNFLNPIQINSIQNFNSQMNSVNTLNANLQQQQQQNNSVTNNASPTSSPVKPNIIRKPRRDSPSSSNTNNEHNSNMPQDYQGQHTIKNIKNPIFDFSNQETNGSKIISLSTLPIPTTFISQQPTAQQQQQQTSQLNMVNLTNTEPQVLAFATTSTIASSSSKPVINLNQTDDLNKNIRKFQMNTQSTAATSSSSASSSAPSSSSCNNEPQALLLEQKEDLNQQTTRKRRKQEFIRKPQIDEPVINSPFCPNRYLNENTYISNSTSLTTQKLNKKINKIFKNDLKHGDLCEEDPNEQIRSSIDEDEPLSKQTKLDITKLKKINTENDEDDYLDDETVQLLSKEFSYVASNGVKWVSKKRSNIALSKMLKPGYNARKNHFVHYSDIKQEQDDDLSTKNTSSSTKITPKELIENLNEWKFHFVISQVKNLMNYENESLDVINEMENLMQNSNFINYSDVCIKINESIKANSQRHKFVNEQLDEAQALIHKLFDSKDKFKNVMLLSASQTVDTLQVSQTSTQLDSLLSTHLDTQQQKAQHSLKKQFKNKNSINTRSNIQKSTFKQSK